MTGTVGLFYAILALIGFLTGWIAGGVVKSAGFGRRVDVVAGVIGAVGGGFAFSKLAIETSGWFVPMVFALVCAVVLLTIVRVIATFR